jgi:hypothetical protein
VVKLLVPADIDKDLGLHGHMASAAGLVFLDESHGYFLAGSP